MTPTTCAHCGGSIGLPHVSEIDCFRELDREMAATVRQLRALTNLRSQLLRARMRVRQQPIADRATDISRTQTRFADSLGLRRPSPLAARRVGQNERKH
jgi:hypothetical protein